MALTTAQQVDLLWKKMIFGTTETSYPGKTGSNETIASPLPVYSSNIWAQTDTTSIPATPPTTNTATIGVYTASTTPIQATSDITAPPNQTWLATSAYGTATTRMGNWIPPTFNPLYVMQVWIGNPKGGPAARILPDTSNEEWVFDYIAGTLYFENNVPASKTATVGTGTVTVAGNGIYFVGYQYTGVMGGNPSIPAYTIMANATATTTSPTGVTVTGPLQLTGNTLSLGAQIIDNGSF